MGYYNQDRCQWDLAKLSPNEFYEYISTGEYPAGMLPQWGALSFPVDPDQPDQPTDPDDPGEPSQRTDPSIPDEPKLPQTGAGSRWSLAGILGAAGMILLLFGIFSKKKYHGKREA